MRIRTYGAICLALAALIAPLAAQEAKEQQKQAQAAEEKGWSTKIIELKYRDARLLHPVLEAFPQTMRWRYSSDLRVIAVTGPPELVAAVEEAIKRLDVPGPTPKNIELTVYVLAALQQATPPESVPKELEPVTKQLSSLFSYQGFRVLDTMILRVRDGQGGDASGAGPAPTGPTQVSQRIQHSVRFGTASVTSDGKGNVVRVDNLRFGARVPVPTEGGGWMFMDTGFNTNIDVREGQKVVVGKANIDGSNNAMILVVTARVIE